MRRLVLLLGVLSLVAAPLAAQQDKAQPAADKGGKTAPPAARPPAEETRLVFEREIYTYPGGSGRRDPFRPLTGSNDTGPMFTDLKLRSIMYVPGTPARSSATIVDAANKTYRVRRGDVVGNATVLDVGQQRVLFAVEDFGLRRQEVLEMKPTTGRGRTR